MLYDVQLLGHFILFGGQLEYLGFASTALFVWCIFNSFIVSLRLMMMRSLTARGFANTAGDWKRGLNSSICICSW
jgi:hypothetical protein